jgi:FixJ family two-component response regulator
MAARTIAVVDDDEDVRKALSRLLRAAGFAVRTYASGEEFLARPPGGEPDCLVLDIHLTGMSGLELRRELLERGVGTPVIFITALDDRATMEAVSRAHAAACLLKPLEESALIGSIACALEPLLGE